MKTLTDQLAQYAAYHRDRRNIATHFVGIPMIVVAVATLLSRPGIDVGGLLLTPALVVTGLTVAYYLLLDLRFGLAMAVAMAASLAVGYWFAAHSTAFWLTGGIGLFVAGWVLQFIGHYYEGKKPAFVDDLVGLVIGPLFVMAEAAFALGLRDGERQRIEARVGPTLIRPRAAQA
ncbi:MAG TPA: Mpo1-like protein [Burkholderiaceae bacterium]